MTPAVLADLVRCFADDVLTRRGLDPAVLPTTITVQRPRDPHQGDYTTTVALQTARKVGVDPYEFAGWLAEALVTSPAVHSAEVAGPGFLNLRLAGEARAGILRNLLAVPSAVPSVAARPELATSASATVPGSAGGEVGASGVGQPCAGYGDRLRVVQRAHARLSSLTRNAADLAITAEGAPLGLLEDAREVELICALGDFPRIVALGESRRLVRYLEGLAEYQHNFSDVCRMLPMGDEEPEPLHAARLALGEATRRVLAEGLGLLGASAPEWM